MSKRKLNQAAPRLLSAAKEARRVLLSIDNTSDHNYGDLLSVLEMLDSAITAADDRDWTTKLKVTPRTADAIYSGLDSFAEYSSGLIRQSRKYTPDQLMDLKRWLEAGERRTVRRVYFTLDLDGSMLQLLEDFLCAYDPGAQTQRAFDRLVEQIEGELRKSPLERLAEQGL